MIGERIRSTREAAGLSKSELAERAGVTRNTLAAIEGGSARPQSTTIDSIASALGVPRDALEEDGPMPEPNTAPPSRREPAARRPRERAPSKGRAGMPPKKVQRIVHAAIAMADVGASILVPRLWVTPPDRLTEDEKKILTTAFSEEVQKSPRAMRFLDQLTTLGARAGIAGALLLVALPRRERRGLVPAFVTEIFGNLAGAVTADAPPEPPPQREAEVIDLRPRQPEEEEQPPNRAAEA